MSTTDPTRNANDPPPPVRHIEPRRIATCAFANRVAELSVQHYRQYVADPPPATCVATVVAHHFETNQLTVIAMGVGTKFLSDDGVESGEFYGGRVRDCHAEVLVRRAFRRHLTETIRCFEDKNDDSHPSLLLERSFTIGSSPPYRLLPGVTLHVYCSSAPCGNAVVKKFATFTKEVYDEKCPPHKWPEPCHAPMEGHSIPLGQFALLLKQKRPANSDSTTQQQDDKQPKMHCRPVRHTLTPKQRKWPIFTSTSWCPPGTTPVWNAKSGSHTCSDKLARWQTLGWQGAILHPWVGALHVTTLTVGRKFSHVACARAVCCRCARKDDNNNHPTLMGTNVYLDDGAKIVDEQPQRFHAHQAWTTWYSTANEGSASYRVECIDAYTGYLASGNKQLAAVATRRLVEDLMPKEKWSTLADLRALKQRIAPHYEERKDQLLTHHPVFRDWSRREDDHSHNDTV